MKYANRPLALLVAGALVVTLAGCSSAVSTITASCRGYRPFCNRK